MKIEVVLIDSIDGDNLTSLKNYDENKNLFEINKFEAKKNQMFYMSSLNSTGETTTLIVGTDGCESDYDFVDLGASIGKKINNDCDLKLIFDQYEKLCKHFKMMIQLFYKQQFKHF